MAYVRRDSHQSEPITDYSSTLTLWVQNIGRICHSAAVQGTVDKNNNYNLTDALRNIFEVAVNIFTVVVPLSRPRTHSVYRNLSCKLLTGESFGTSCIEELTAADLVRFKYAPSVSTDVEGSFSKYNTVLRDKRRSLTFESLRMLIVTYCNNSE
jgi:hypothetical protein